MMRNYKKLLSTMAMAGFLGAGCLGGSTPTPTNPDPSNPSNPSDPSNPTPIANNPSDPANGNNTSSGGTGGTFDHMNDDTVDPFQVLARIQEEGPPEVSTRMHSCGKMKYATLGRVLASMGVTMTGNGTTPNGLFTSGASALGKPDYTNRTPESTLLSTAGAVRLYDIIIASAPQIITAMPNNMRCTVGGTAAAMFDATGCTMAGISCLTGAPATQAQKDLCDSAVASNTTDKVGTAATAPTVGQVIAVASLAAAAHSCE
jgi:hypothetical protein